MRRDEQGDRQSPWEAEEQQESAWRAKPGANRGGVSEEEGPVAPVPPDGQVG